MLFYGAAVSLVPLAFIEVGKLRFLPGINA